MNNLEVMFYHLTSSPFDKTLFTILNKAYLGGMRAFVLANDASEVSDIDSYLWSLGRISFLPHCTLNDDNKAIAPVVIGESLDESASYDVIVPLNHNINFNPDSYKKVIDIFNGNNESELLNARNRWKNYKNLNYNLKYWYQDPKGNWLQKAV